MPSEDSRHSDVRHARDSDGNPSELGLTTLLSELARELQAEPDMDTLLHRIVATAVEEVDGATHGGISLRDGKLVRAVAATDPVVEQLDRLQEKLGEGPCLSSLTEHITVRADDFSSDQRWPKFTASAHAEGVGSMLAVQLFVAGDNLGALNLYATEANVFTDTDEYTAMALAAHAAVAMKGRQIESNLRTALSSRDVIGQGKGILMERYKIDSDEAFHLLMLASQRTHRKLRDVAEELATSGELRTD